jgi:hypothetical protein
MRVVTGEVRFSYLNVFTPRAFEGQEPKYSTAILIPKSDKKTIDKINRAVADTLKEKANLFGGKVPTSYRHPLRDGDVEKPEDEVYAGHFFMNVSNKKPVGLVDAERNPILDENELKSGDYGRVALTPYAYNNAGNRGVAFALDNLQLLREGEPLGSPRPSAEEDFAENSDIF